MTSPELIIVHATAYGQTEKIPNRIADVARADGLRTTVLSVDDAYDYPFEAYNMLILAGSIRFGHHQRNLENFIRRKLPIISQMNGTLVSVSGSAATPEGKAEAEGYVHDLSRRTGWVPPTFITVAGAEPYTRYGFLTRWIMRSMARRHGRIVDVQRDYEFTNWDEVERFAHQFCSPVESGSHAAALA